ncbi:MAG: hypothetical protein ABMB14_16790 [Myxococcota bacterium]
MSNVTIEIGGTGFGAKMVEVRGTVQITPRKSKHVSSRGVVHGTMTISSGRIMIDPDERPSDEVKAIAGDQDDVYVTVEGQRPIHIPKANIVVQQHDPWVVCVQER